MLTAREGRARVEQAQILSRQGDYAGAMRENREVLDRSPKSAPGDAALFNMGLIFADRANPERDDGKALGFFARLEQDFPRSPLTESARIWSGVLRDEIGARERSALLERVQERISLGEFDAALRENQAVLDRSPQGPLADAALFGMGQVFADPANPGRDCKKALGFLTQLAQDFPRSPLAEGASARIGLLQRELAAEQERGAYLQRVQTLIRKGEFDAALRESQKVLDRSPQGPLADAALFSMGQIFADHANPGKECRKALDFFARLGRDFPRSPLAEGARLWTGVIETEAAAAQERSDRLQRLQIPRGDFDTALRENQKILDRSPKGPLADEALFGLGLLYAARANPRMDYRKALGYFTRLKNEWPGSPFADEARIWTGVLETMEKALLVDIEVEHKKQVLQR